MSDKAAGPEFRADDLVLLRRAWDAGKASGQAGHVDFGALRLEARQRLARHPHIINSVTMMTIEEARQRVEIHLGASARAGHSFFVGNAMMSLAHILCADAHLWEVVGLCHDIDFAEIATDRRRHGLLTAEWLAEVLPTEALNAIRAHDHRTGVQADTPIADALKLADALAIADEVVGRETVLRILKNDKE